MADERACMDAGFDAAAGEEEEAHCGHGFAGPIALVVPEESFPFP